MNNGGEWRRLHVRREIVDLAVNEMNNDAVYLIIRFAGRGKTSQAKNKQIE